MPFDQTPCRESRRGDKISTRNRRSAKHPCGRMGKPSLARRVGIRSCALRGASQRQPAHRGLGTMPLDVFYRSRKVFPCNDLSLVQNPRVRVTVRTASLKTEFHIRMAQEWRKLAQDGTLLGGLWAISFGPEAIRNGAFWGQAELRSLERKSRTGQALCRWIPSISCQSPAEDRGDRIAPSTVPLTRRMCGRRGEADGCKLGLDSKNPTPWSISLRFLFRARRGPEVQRICDTDLRLVRMTSSVRRLGGKGLAAGDRDSVLGFLASCSFFEHGTLWY
jgi:hypothetical protein